MLLHGSVTSSGFWGKWYRTSEVVPCILGLNPSPAVSFTGIRPLYILCLSLEVSHRKEFLKNHFITKIHWLWQQCLQISHFGEKDYSHSLRRRWTPLLWDPCLQSRKKCFRTECGMVSRPLEHSTVWKAMHSWICIFTHLFQACLLRLFLCSGNCVGGILNERSRCPAPVELTFSGGGGEREGAESDKISLEKYYSVVKDQLGDLSKKVTFQLRHECHEGPSPGEHVEEEHCRYRKKSTRRP